MSTRLSIPELGVDTMFAPRISQENAVVQPDDPTNIPEEDLDPDLIEPDDDLDPDDTDDDADDADDAEEDVLPLPEPGAPLAPGHYAIFDVADESDTREEPQEGGEGLSLESDPETSMVGSVFLHLLSEHQLYEALHLEEDEARLLHERMHAQAALLSITIDHDVADLRFRPRRALAASMRHADNLHAASFELVQ